MSGILFYQLPFILAALLHVDLIKLPISWHVPLSGHDDDLMTLHFMNDSVNDIESTRISIITS